MVHAKLTSPEEVAHWKAFWGEWLGALDEAASPPTASG
jgi:hypothetical protein